MEPSFNCDLCSSQFALDCVPYELPCKHKYCYKCLSTICKSNEETIICKKDDKEFDEKFQDIPIASFFLKFLNQSLCSALRLVCLGHNNKEIEFVCHEHSSFLCSLCLWDHCEHKTSTAFYSGEDLANDLKKVEDRLIDLDEKLKFFTSQINEMRANKTNGSKRVSLFFTEVSRFLKTPFIENIEKEKDDIFPLIDIEKNINSRILKNEKDIKFISNSLETPINNLKLLFRASESNFDSQIFHQKCDNKGSTLTLIKTKNGKTFGGYNKASWNSNSAYLASEGNFIFSLDNKTKHEIYQNQGQAMYGNASFGPTFGGGHDIYVTHACNNNISSYSNFGHTYKPPGNITQNTESAKNYFAGSYNFGVEEYEVFLIKK